MAAISYCGNFDIKCYPFDNEFDAIGHIFG